MANTPTKVAETQGQKSDATVIPLAEPSNSIRVQIGVKPSFAASVGGSGNFAFVQGSTPISIETLYQARDAGSKEFGRALDLLAKACEILSEARRAVEEGDQMGCQAEVLEFEQLLQPLFECRAIGEGFANVINTITFGISNLAGAPLNKAQVGALWRVMRGLFTGPFLSFEDSLGIVQDLEKVGLNLNSEFVSEWASESSTIGKEQGIR